MPHELTRNQQIVLDALKRSGTPMSAYQLLDADGVRESGVKAPLTVYRALAKLVEAGHVHRIETLNAFVSCDHGPHAEPAAFMICDVCKRTIEVGTAALMKTISDEARRQDFLIDKVHVEIAGRCAECEQ